MTDPERAADVAAAMSALDRRAFLPPEQVEFAAEDRPLPLGHGQTNSQPSTVAAMLRLLHVPVGARVLDVGAGSGWTTALLARLVGPEGSVTGIELEPDLAVAGAANLAAWGMPWATLDVAHPGVLGRPGPEGYDRILVSAAARELPQSLVDQLRDGGRMVIPVRRRMLVVERRGDRIGTSEHGSYLFVPLR
ncbi:protein-L-isoaspartate O-methyltransferase [Cellulomonas fimi]|uniref:Protein-L-isoaspartate O-methyltransferase n=1 Tax=Cellulomonas fimi TaxID=1708 RepID=A0A7Y0LYT6_CELFI|nr:protein-L-isoaspartate O-methyltransferase [Cellulomonas fimi]NMR20374.1 protein-L-isoaspartate O-methyltransferase [Cellulomonas fimi]